jgi:predicted MFS family arabinose efflux permease
MGPVPLVAIGVGAVLGGIAIKSIAVGVIGGLIFCGGLIWAITNKRKAVRY